MPCNVIQTPTGVIIACSRGGARPKRCVGCKRYTADRLCDVPIVVTDGARRSCDAPICRVCSIRLGDDDVCTAHPVPDEALARSAATR